MEALGIDIQMPIDRLRRAITDIGIGFLFAQRFHSSMKHVMPARTQLKIRTVFNILGPLANPAAARIQWSVCPRRKSMELMANALTGSELDHAFVVHGEDGMDEISISGPTHVMEMRGGRNCGGSRSFPKISESPPPRSKRSSAETRGRMPESSKVFFSGERGPRATSF